jgi:hypothetical protein
VRSLGRRRQHRLDDKPVRLFDLTVNRTTAPASVKFRIGPVARIGERWTAALGCRPFSPVQTDRPQTVWSCPWLAYSHRQLYFHLLTFDMVLCSDLQRSQHFGRYLHRCAGPPTTNVKAVAARQSCTGTGDCIIVEVCSLLPHTGKFGVKVSLVVTHKQGLMVGARSCPGNPYDGHVLSAQLEQTTNLLQDLGRSPKQVIVDLGYRGVDADNPGVQIIHRGKYKSLTDYEKRLLKGDRAADRPHEDRSPDGSVLASRCDGRRAARPELCGGLQRPLAAAGDRPSRPERAFFRPLGCARVPRLLVARCGGADQSDGLGSINAPRTCASSAVVVTCCAGMNSAGPTMYRAMSSLAWATES